MKKRNAFVLAGIVSALLTDVAAALPLQGNVPGVFAFGVGNNAIGDTARLSGMPVRYRYQYLVGGLGANDWRYWNSPDGAFVDLWLSESRSAGLTPVLTYYEIVQAAPYAYEEPPTRNLGTAGTMKAYFENFRFLMQRIAAFGDAVVVHVEPDLFGYMQHNSSDPTRTYVAVAASGLPEAAGLEDNARGFARMLVKLRDAYAPNVILGWHASAWATGVDLIANQGDPDALGLATANFYKSLGAPFDVMFSEFSDRDAGYYQVQGEPGHWWQESDFTRFRSFVSRLTQEVGQKAILWQVPIGNTFHRACNNTAGHYQDNRAEYFFEPLVASGDKSRIADYLQAGVVAMLFGAGESTQTRYFDNRGDGVTNPAPIDNRFYNHTTHLNDRYALNSDDDGGYLRQGIASWQAQGPLAWDTAPLPLRLDPAAPGCDAGTNVAMTVRLGTTASAATTVTLTAGGPAVTVPASVTVPAGASSAGFAASCVAAGSATVTAQSGQETASATFTVRTPPQTLALGPASASCVVGKSVTLTASLGTPMSTPTTVTLTSGNSKVVTVPTSVSVPAQGRSVSFQAACKAVGSATVTGKLPTQQSATAAVSVRRK